MFLPGGSRAQGQHDQCGQPANTKNFHRMNVTKAKAMTNKPASNPPWNRPLPEFGAAAAAGASGTDAMKQIANSRHLSGALVI